MLSAIKTRAERYQRFYESNKPGDLMIVVRQDPYWVKKKNLFEYDFNNGGHLEMAEDMAICAEGMLEWSEESGDDLIPWMTPDLGIAVHHTFIFDLPVQFSEWTSWAPHPLSGDNGYDRLDEVVYNPENRWAKIMKEMVEYWGNRASQPYLFNGHNHYSPLDLANAIRGNDLFTDFYEYPDEVTGLMRRCTETIIAFEKDLRRFIPADRPGMPFWGAMAPQGAIFMSEDAMDMCGPNVSMEWGQPWSKMIQDEFGCAAVHHHMMGANLQGIIGSYVQNSIIQISNDPNCPPATDRLKELYEMSNGNALMFDCDINELPKIKDQLKDIRAIVVTATGTDKQAAKDAVKLVREISNIG
jgi:hypothetical protein